MRRLKNKSIEQAPSSNTLGSRKMSLELKVNTSFKHSIDFVKDRVVSNIVEARTRGMFKLNDREFEALCNIVNMSFEQAGSGAFKQIDSLVRDIKKDYAD